MTTAPSPLLIVGQGLAGSLLTWALEARGASYTVVDDDHRSAATRAAAGLINPVAGRRYQCHSRTAELLATARATYNAIGQRLGLPLYHPRPALRPFDTAAARERYERQRNGGCRPWLGEPLTAAMGLRIGPLGAVPVREAGYLETQRLLEATRDRLLASGQLQRQPCTSSELEPIDHGVVWRGTRYRAVVFCEGYRVRENPWFAHLPLQPAKGEILTLRTQAERPQAMLLGGRWLIPLAEPGLLRLGATNSWAPLDEEATPAGRAELLAALATLLDPLPAVEVVAQRAGVRPGTPDRAPLVGPHPDHPQLYVCNGFGARGSLLAPWYVAQLADHLTLGTPLPQESDPRRYADRRLRRPS